MVTRVASLDVETDKAADRILDVSGVTEPQQARFVTDGLIRSYNRCSQLL